MITISRARAEQCAVCGRQKRDGRLLEIGLKRNEYPGGQRFDLCDDCAELLARMILDEVGEEQ